MDHTEKVERIAAELRARTSDAPVSLRKRSPPHQVPKAGDLRRKDDKIDVSDLDRILHIDPAARICVAEPGVTFVDLVAATLRHGLVPMVVPELKTITIGGAVSGCSIESMSFQYGGFHDSCLEYELITGEGEVLTLTPDNEHALVFQMVHGAFGTLGILSKLTFRLVPAKRFVHVRYERHATLEAYLNAIDTHYRRRDVDFMDGIIHSPSQYVLSLGRFVDSAPYSNDYEWMKVYWQSTLRRSEDYLRTPDYFFRYNRGVTNVRPKSFLGRLLLGKLVGSTQLLWLAERAPWLLPKDHKTVTLDTFLPFSRVAEFMRWYEQEIGFFPLWCVPYKRVRNYEWLADGFHDDLEDELYVDLAIYGLKQPAGVNYHRMFEEQLYELRGVKTLIAHNFYSEEEFWRTWNERNYAAVKARTDPRNRFRTLYEKTCRAAMGRPSQ